MSHPALRHIRNTLIAALGLSGCIERTAPVRQPPDGDGWTRPAADGDLPDAALPDAALPDAALPDGALPDARLPDAALADAARVDARPVADATPDAIADAGRAPDAADAGPPPGGPCPADAPTGYAACDDGAVDRVGPARCTGGVGWPECFLAQDDGASDCVISADCDARAGGRCTGGWGGGLCLCVYPCETDDDCRPDEACVCDSVGGSVCAWAACRGPADCAGGRCGVAEYDVAEGCNRAIELACRTAADTCPDPMCPPDLACWPPGRRGGRVPVDDVDAWHCDGHNAICGRPLRVDTRPRLSPADHRADWQAAAPRTGPDADLAAHWRAIAALEHASVASFARFSLQLMALGAPADLLADCQRAAADEVEHARLAYGIASAFAGEAVGPGPLSLDGITLDADPATVLREVIVEGCIGETLGAVEAAEAARTVEDPTIAAACARIAEDELRHAALGWRTARWLLACHPELAPMASEAFADGIQHHTDGIESSPDIIARNGIAARPDLRRAAWRDVIAPLAARLVYSDRHWS